MGKGVKEFVVFEFSVALVRGFEVFGYREVVGRVIFFECGV